MLGSLGGSMLLDVCVHIEGSSPSDTEVLVSHLIVKLSFWRYTSACLSSCATFFLCNLVRTWGDVSSAIYVGLSIAMEYLLGVLRRNALLALTFAILACLCSGCQICIIRPISWPFFFQLYGRVRAHNTIHIFLWEYPQVCPWCTLKRARPATHLWCH